MNAPTVAVTGAGVITPIATGAAAFAQALKEGRTNFSMLECNHAGQDFRFPIARPEGFSLADALAALRLDEGLITRAKRIRNASTSATWSLYCALEAWADAGLDKTPVDPERIAIVVAGSNVQQAGLQTTQEKYREKVRFLPPHYGLGFFDTDIAGILSELLSIKGEGQSVGASSASGNMGVIQGHRLLAIGAYDAVLVVAPLMDLSIYEYQGFVALGAMADANGDLSPSGLCRPFDAGHRGFVYGQCAGCLVLESVESAARRGLQPYGHVTGYGLGLDANRNPNPSVDGEQRAILSALHMAGIDAGAIDYVNTHGTAARIGDETEVAALLGAGLRGVKANSTKSLTGHGLSAAGLVECIATFLQMKEGFLHPTHNLAEPISRDIDWIAGETRPVAIRHALSNSFGFGGISTSLVLKKNNES